VHLPRRQRLGWRKLADRHGGTPDTTAWGYEEATGLLTNKVYADGKGVSYAYTAEGKLLTAPGRDRTAPTA